MTITDNSNFPDTPSESAENFLKAVYSIQQTVGPNKRVSTNALAELLGIKAPSVTDMAQKLTELGYIHYKKYQGVRLTKEGEIQALKILRRHRLIELFLVESLGYALHEVHDEAERLEHAVSERFITAISQKLGDPEIDPHGDPIPREDGTVLRRNLLPLVQLPEHCPATIARFLTDSNEMLEHMLTRGIQLQKTIEVIHIDPFEGPLTVKVNNTTCILGYNVARCILVDNSDC